MAYQPRLEDIQKENYNPSLEDLEDIKLSLNKEYTDSLMGQLSNVPSYAWNDATELPGKIVDTLKQVPGAAGKMIAHPIEGTRDLAGGVARGSQRLASSGLELGEYLTRKGTEGLLHATGHKGAVVPKWNAREFMGLEGNNPIDLGKAIESENPNALLSGIGQYGLGASAGGAKLLPMMIANALNSSAQANPGERLQQGVEGLVNAGLPVGAGKLVYKGFNAARPSNLLRGNLSPEELQANLEAAEGTNTGLGDILQSPTLKYTQENLLPYVPFSGAGSTMQKTAHQLTEKGQNLLNKIGHELPEGNHGELMQDALIKASKEAEKQKTKIFNLPNKTADKMGLVVGRENFRTEAKKILSELEKSPELKRKMSPAVLDDLNEYSENEKGNSLKLSNIFKGKIREEGSNLYKTGNTHEYGIMSRLKNALGKDIDEAMENSGNPELMAQHKAAMENYKTNYRPFEDTNVTKFTRREGDTDLMLSHFLKSGSNDRSLLLSKLTSKLPKHLEMLPLHSYLSKAVENGKFKPKEFRTLYENLGEKQKKLLIPDAAMRKEIEKYTESVNLNNNAFDTMFNPKTGNKALTLIPTFEALLGYGAHGIPGAMGAIAGLGTLGNITNKALTSPRIRESLVKAIIKNKMKQKS